MTLTNPAVVYSAKNKTLRRFWIKSVFAVAIAAACLIFGAPLMLSQTRASGPVDFSSLPKLPINTNLGSFGFEGLLAYDVSELSNGNPWTENNDLITLPVFNNPTAYDGAGAPTNGLSPEEMLADAEKIAHILGLEIAALYTEPTTEQVGRTTERLERLKERLESADAFEEELRQRTAATQATAECNGAIIEVEKDGYIIVTLTPETAELIKEIDKLSDYGNFRIDFDFGYETIEDTRYYKGLPLPDGRKFGFRNTSGEQAMEITQYLFSEYGAFSGIKTPGYDLSADYTYNGVLTRLNTFAFENAGSLTERILNYHFNRLYFRATDLGGWGGIHYYNADLSRKIGDYPIITVQEARQLLLKSHYITTVPEEFPGEQYIAHVELTYRTSTLDAVFIPYYRFLIEMPAMQRNNGLKTFGAFYVPAVEGSYLTDIPVWDGSFN